MFIRARTQLVEARTQKGGTTGSSVFNSRDDHVEALMNVAYLVDTEQYSDPDDSATDDENEIPKCYYILDVLVAVVKASSGDVSAQTGGRQSTTVKDEDKLTIFKLLGPVHQRDGSWTVYKQNIRGRFTMENRLAPFEAFCRRYFLAIASTSPNFK